jgi:DNA-binding transcriptional LysR family regulator
MLRYLPSLNALRAFETDARQESFTKGCLSVTQGTVSHQVKALEADLVSSCFCGKVNA